MTKNNSVTHQPVPANERLTESLLTQKLKKMDSIELPMDENFFDNMHNQIMQAVEKTEIKQLNRWAKTWVFLETRAKYYQSAGLKATKTVFVIGALGLSFQLASTSVALFQKVHEQQVVKNKELILKKAVAAPVEWAELAAVGQNDMDIYSEILNERIQKMGLESDQLKTEL